MDEFYHSNTGKQPNSTEIDLEGQLEALLFIAPGAVSISQLAEALDIPSTRVNKYLDLLGQEYRRNSSSRGLRLQRFSGRVQLTTAPQTAQLIEKFLGLDIGGRLSKAALEALAIVAYQQPVTRPYVDSIRGVNSDGVLKNLLGKGMIVEVGRANSPGRPILYSTSVDFLQYFGLSSLLELPPLNLEEEDVDGIETTSDVLEGY